MNENMFCGQVIGCLPRYPNIKVREGDILECRVEKIKHDYSHPILDYERGTFELPKIKTIIDKKGVVKYCEDLFEFRIHFYRSDGSFEERRSLCDMNIRFLNVIGSIYDNPELLIDTKE